jgi:DNA ligase-associated metallophosphoesterase
MLPAAVRSRQPAPDVVHVIVGGEPLALLPQRAAWHQGTGTLLVADVHLGKGASFRALGVPVPAGSTEATLARLAALVDGTGARRLVVLGDLLHGPAARRGDTAEALQRWRDARPGLECVLVRGNHDGRAGDPPARCRFAAVDGPLALGGLRVCHEPAELDDGYALGGHLHPAWRLRGRADSLRLPCFWLRPRWGVLPAFGEFTGGWTIEPGAGDRVYLTDGQALFAAPPVCARV